jgi:hypothetical protein
MIRLSCHSERSEESLIISCAGQLKVSQICFASLLMNTADRCAWWNMPVAGLPTGDVLRCLPISGLRIRWTHRLEVHVPLTRAYRRKHPMFIPAPKIAPNVLGNLNMTTGCAVRFFSSKEGRAPVRPLS